VSDQNQTWPTTSQGSTLLWGSVLTLAGAAVTAINWYTVLTDGSYYIVASIMGPVIAGIGLAMLLAPAVPSPDTTLSALHRVRRYLALGVFFLGIAVGIADFAAFNGWLPVP
jgi:hypothetical protein